MREGLRPSWRWIRFRFWIWVAFAGCTTVAPESAETLPGDLAPSSSPEEASRLRQRVRDKLARIGLVTLSDDEAGIPQAERGRYLPCRVRSGAQGAPLEDYPGGYLIVGWKREEVADVDRIRQAIDQWEPGTFFEVLVRRNSYLSGSSEWWQRDVKMWLPD